MLAVLHRPGRKGELARAHARAFDLGASDGLCRVDRGQVLPEEARLGPPRPDLLDHEGAAGEEGEREGRAEDLSPALPVAPVELDRVHDYPFTQTTCFKVATISTRSSWAFITASMDL